MYDIRPVTGEGQQFVTMTSKNGNYFYLIIDRDDKGNETVHLLNQVDERDLLNLMEDDEVAYYEEQIEEQKQKAADAKAESEKLEEELKETRAAKSSEIAETGETEADPETPEDLTAEKGTGKSKIILVVILLAALGGCGYWLVKKMKKNKPAKKAANTPDVDDYAGEELEILVDDTEE